MKSPDFYMQHALDAAWQFQLLTFPNPAVGAVCIGSSGEILSIAAHKYAGGPHAEVYALRDAYGILSGDMTLQGCDDSHEIHNYLLKNHNGLFSTTSMAVTLEPCSHSGKTPSCANLIATLGIQKLFIACADFNPIASNGRHQLESMGVECVFGVLEEKGQQLLEPFLKWQEQPFVFFKWAQRLDGTIDNGIISSQDARCHVHALRDKCDLLVIGGDTVRTDRPVLDSRMVNGKAPDVLIYSHGDNFDRSIALFGVPNRSVFVESSLQRIHNYSLVMIEGGASMLHAVREVCNWYVCYIAPKIGHGSVLIGAVQEDFEVMHAKIDDNILLWMRKKG
jgi:diaminohydroxyphosphoribosylaminopyrimidine deaminase/5-amino-6-(5-phosphoribosylamino)uracil reductase